MKPKGINERTVDSTTAGSRPERRKKGGKYIQQKQKRQRGIMIAVIFMLLGIIGIMLYSLNRNPLVGRWYMDSVTVYQFKKDGTGKMILPMSEYEFTYTTENGVLIIDFLYEGAKDAEYEYEINGDELTLKGGNATTHGVYELTRKVH